MKKLHKARIAMNVVGSLVFSVGMLGLLAGTARANPVGNPTFCDPATTVNPLNTGYDNTDPQPHGLNGRGAWADLRHGSQIFAVYDANPANCLLELIGSVGSAGDMWITLLDPPYYLQTEPILGCPTNINAEVRIKKYDNRKAVGFVTNYDAASGKGLFLGLYDNGNTDALTLSTFEANGTTTGQLTSTVVTLSLGSKIKENVWYTLQFQNLCVDRYAGISAGSAFVTGGSTKIIEAMPISAINDGLGDRPESRPRGDRHCRTRQELVRRLQREEVQLGARWT